MLNTKTKYKEIIGRVHNLLNDENNILTKKTHSSVQMTMSKIERIVEVNELSDEQDELMNQISNVFSIDSNLKEDIFREDEKESSFMESKILKLENLFKKNRDYI